MQQKVKIWVKLFVLFHVIAITVWALPVPPTAILNGQVAPSGTNWVTYWNQKHLKPFPPLHVYAKTLGFWQYWDMFAPDPARVDRWGDADIVYLNGTIKHYAYPRMANLSIWDKFIEERYRKFFERSGNDQFTYLWPNFARRIAILNDDPTNPPVEVRVFRHFKTTMPPGEKQPDSYKTDLYYIYAVDPKELASLRRAER